MRRVFRALKLPGVHRPTNLDIENPWEKKLWEDSNGGEVLAETEEPPKHPSLSRSPDSESLIYSDSNLESIDPERVSSVVSSLVFKNKNQRRDSEWFFFDMNPSRVTQPPREVVIYSDEVLRERVDVEIPLQIKHTTTNPVIPSSLASVPCRSLGIDALLCRLNEVLQTSYSVDFAGLLPHLQQCIERDYDFGTAFGRLRNYWFDDLVELQETLDARERTDIETRDGNLDLEKNLIIDPHIGPRRVWDLYSNRVLPAFITRVAPPINGYEWRVPLPTDTSLDRIRIEMLNFGAEYVWLDVLCLRQEDSSKPEKEDVRVEEWKMDVPTIGSIYWTNVNVVTYLSGLGRPFEIGDIASERHWLNRAWTLQEAAELTLIGGMTSHSPFPILIKKPQDELELRVKQYYDRLSMRLSATDFWQFTHYVFLVIEAMRDRSATSELDKIAGLAYMLRTKQLPVYVRGKDDTAAHEEAWSHLVKELRDHHCLQLAFQYPAPGDGEVTWRPSWGQLKNKTRPLPRVTSEGASILPSYYATVASSVVEKDGSYGISGYLLRNCTLQHLTNGDPEGYCRQGLLTVMADSLTEELEEYSFTVVAHHQHSIPEDQLYVLVGPTDCTGHRYFWIVGVYTESGSIRKVSVVEMGYWDDRDELIRLKLASLETVNLVRTSTRNTFRERHRALKSTDLPENSDNTRAEAVAINTESESSNTSGTEVGNINLGRHSMAPDCSDCNHPSSEPSIALVDPERVSHVVQSLVARYNKWEQWRDARLLYNSPQEVVIYSDDQLREDVALSVPLQIKHATTNPVISSTLASVPCESLSVAGLLDKLNEVLGTSYSTDIPGLVPLLQRCIERQYDFGTAYSRLRTCWFSHVTFRQVYGPDIQAPAPRENFKLQQENFDDKERRDKEERDVLSEDERLALGIPRRVELRRVWDLYSNRVVPMWAVADLARYGIWAVSHGEVEESQMQYVDTPINRHEWLVPLPADTTLDRVRVELLNLGAVYVWLDVLCMRQKDGSKPDMEAVREHEWKLDVPMIGRAYRGNSNIVLYFSGLGRPFEMGDTPVERRRMKQAWSLQAGSTAVLIGGLTARSSFPPNTTELREDLKHSTRFDDEIRTALSDSQDQSDRMSPVLTDETGGVKLKKSSTLPERLECRCSWSASKPNDRFIDARWVSEVTTALTARYNKWKQWTDRRLSYTSPQVVTIYSDEELREDADLAVPLQIKHTTTQPVISSSLASVSCESLGLDALLGKLNEVLGTSYAVDVPGMLPILQQCIERRYDFGMAFGRLRKHWLGDLTRLRETLDAYELKDWEFRRRAVDRVKGMVMNPFVDPRRVWDLYSNRILPTWVLQDTRAERPWAISHSWMAVDLRYNISTPINGYEWQVPLPIDTTLDRIRIELLNLGAEYAWLDVLCLRQEDSTKPEDEDIRVEEWRLDVPTIGRIYQKNPNIVTYLSGLGRPFEIGDTSNERHWLNRAWTLQEGRGSTLIGGIADCSPTFPPDTGLDPSVKQYYDHLCMTLSAGQNTNEDVFLVLEAMLDRAATFEFDRIAGLAYVLCANNSKLPGYYRGQDESYAHEEAWSALVGQVDERYRLQLAFEYPAPGNGDVTWRPSWSQLKAKKTPRPLNAESRLMVSSWSWQSNSVTPDGSYSIFGHLLRDCIIESLSEPDAEGYCRRGKLTVKVNGSIEKGHSFRVKTHHQYPISENETYVLVGSNWGHAYWMVGKYTASESIQKFTVVSIEDKDDRDRLRNLCLAMEAWVTLG
ncbi:hypothetical protein NM688_g4441 [Phlebia brevispora]|uniref:Uncharacterized protein n=1 Tax=Phlebia brevispora TaxID=194682 RepID=A0ACC1T2X1_9APHY|nr:hypothetical protein NM688_g4441 [Phlebia brevispora]